MTEPADELEQRLRETLHRPAADERARLDTAGLLDRVHRGARRRRTLHVAAGLATVLVVAGAGGYLVDAVGLPTSRPATVADGPTRATAPSTLVSPGTTGSSPTTSTTPTTSAATSPPSRRTSRVVVGPPRTVDNRLGFVATNPPVRSLTATGTARQWALAQVSCRVPRSTPCEGIFTTGDAGASWDFVGRAPARHVTDLRFAGPRRGGSYDGWLFGHALLSTHDGGTTWRRVTLPSGPVTRLAAWGHYVYAVTSAHGSGPSALWRSPVSSDRWQRVHLGARLGAVPPTGLAVASGVIAVLDLPPGARPSLLVSHDGRSWTRATPCPAGWQPSQLSTAADYLWAICSDTTQSIAMASNDDGQTWARADGVFSPADLLAARDDTALVTGPGVSGVEVLAVGSAMAQLSPAQLGTADFFAFTNPRTGYLLSSAGSVLRTSDGGATWLPYRIHS